MHLDVVDLRNFYYRTGLGRAAQRVIRNQVVSYWPDASRQTVAGFGFAVPLLRPYLADARRVVALMPDQQGVMHWPAGMENTSTLCQEIRWPLQTGVVDRLVVMHGLETSENQTALLDECWRVLGPGGKALFIVPNRGGVWSRSDSTPFGYGRPYSLGQLEAQLKLANFVPERHKAVLFQPPSNKKFWLRSGPVLEKIGRQVTDHLAGGVLMLEVSKQVYAQTGTGSPQAIKRAKGVLGGLRPVPEAKPAYNKGGAKPAYTATTQAANKGTAKPAL
ncbi:class I SAM-dependent methyltransferase [Pacificibacter marinus]|uniref:class I SAM-dependent methyltransferase n=1 Tax=Pacificibacter marinus TaxID=658057 RepID=UPI0020915FD8|nr:class I SAM-dependent methyltransferase [Pacificibacter marinus]